MPSGAKKRKAAKRKQQQQNMGFPHPPPPDSPPNFPPSHPQGNGGVHIHDPCTSTSTSTSDEDSVEGNKMASAGRGAPELGQVFGSKQVEEVPPSSSSSSSSSSGTQKELSVEFVKTKEVEPTEIESVPEVSVVPVVQSDPANEHVLQSVEALAETFEAAVDASTHQGEANTLSVVDAFIEQLREAEMPAFPAATENSEADAFETRGNIKPCDVEMPEPTVTIEPHERDTTDVTMTTEVTSASLLQHRATWWNCCGLLDVFSQR